MKRCDVCGQRVEISTDKEGTSCYIPKEADYSIQNLVSAMKKLLTQRQFKFVEDCIVNQYGQYLVEQKMRIKK